MSDRARGSSVRPPRLPDLPPEHLTPEQAELYRTFTEGPRQQHASFFAVTDDNGILSGPYRAMLLSPDVGSTLEQVGVAVRYRSGLPSWARELSILMVACHCRCPVEWHAHERLARAAGVPEATIESLGTENPALLDEQAEVTYAFVAELLDHHVSDGTYADAEALWSKAGVFELVATVGYYQLIAGINHAFALST